MTAIDAAETGVFDCLVPSSAEPGKIIWSKYHEILFGFAPGEFDGTSHSFRSRLHPEDRDRVIEELARARQEMRSYEIETRVCHPDGTVKWVLARGKPFFDDSLKRIRVRGTVVDMTDKKRLSEELIAAKEKAEAATRSKDAFLASISHEIRTPLSAIIGFADLLADPELVSNDRATAVEVVRKNGRHLLELINDILDVSCMELGKLTTSIRNYSPAHVITEAMAAVAKKAQEKQVTLSSSIAPNVPTIIATDPFRLRQILMNLLVNAVKFSHAGGHISISAHVQTGSHSKTSPCYVIDVQDSGAGIAPEFIDSLFKPFAQSQATKASSQGGVGLGLYLSREIAR
ncbi:hypothetical protein E3A20_20420, partial [Planctomyces bekefii]